MFKFFISTILVLGATSSFSKDNRFIKAEDGFLYPKRKPKSYITVGVAGFKTQRADESDLRSNELAKNKEPSAAWSYVSFSEEPFVDQALLDRIEDTFYLSHHDGNKEIKELLRAFGDDRCDDEIGLIINANSWGASKANKLAKAYFEKCGYLSDVFILVDGIQKPIRKSYRKEIYSYNCINYYQREDLAVRGNSISNCRNVELKYDGKRNFARDHIQAEWDGMSKGSWVAQDYIFGNLDPLFIYSEDKIDSAAPFR